MKTFEATTVVEQSGEIRVAGVPFSAGTDVEVIVSAKRQSGDEFLRRWEKVCRELRCLPSTANISDEEIWAEVAEHRAGR